MPQRNFGNIIVFMLIVVLALTAGCTERQAGGEAGENIQTAQAWREQGLLSDLDGQLRLAELYYKKAYETLEDNPAQDWFTYSDAGYRYAWLLCQRGDTEGALAACNLLLEKAEGCEDFPVTQKSGLLSLMAECQLQLAMPEAARQTFERVYRNQLRALGGKERGDFNLALMCGNIYLSYFETGEYAEAQEWLDRYEKELLAWETKDGDVDPSQVEIHHGLIALYKAQQLLATGHPREAAAVYAAIPPGRLDYAQCMGVAATYLMSAGRYAEAADMYNRLDSMNAHAGNDCHTFDILASQLAPRYTADMKAGRTEEALSVGADICEAIDSALYWQKTTDAAELAVIYQTREKELQLKDEETKTTVYRILAFSLVAIMLVILAALWRLVIAHRRVLIKNRELFDLIQREQQREVRDIQRIARQPEQQRTQGEQLFLRLVELMKKEHPYTDSELNRDTLASMLATNHRYVDKAIRECSDSPSTKAFIDSYRVDHAARLLTDTDEPIASIAEMSGFANRTSFNERFRERYKMTPSEYRRAAKA